MKHLWSRASLVPRRLGGGVGGGVNAWYTLFAHAFNLNMFCYVIPADDVFMTIKINRDVPLLYGIDYVHPSSRDSRLPGRPYLVSCPDHTL